MRPAPRRKRRVWLWVLLGVLAVIVVGCVATIAAISTAVDDLDEADEEAVAEVSCVVGGVSVTGRIEVEVTARNGTSGRSDYFVEFELRDADGTFLGDGLEVLTNVPAGESFTDSGFTTVDAPGGSVEGVSCTPVDVNRFASS